MSRAIRGIPPATVRAAMEAALPDAARAPSAHNTQPARWTVDPDGRVVLLEDVTRWLAHSDPTRRDQLLSLGAAWEGIDLALSRHGWGLGEPDTRAPARDSGDHLRPVAAAKLVRRAPPDPLSEVVQSRRTWRGPFARADGATRCAASAVAKALPMATWVTEPALVALLADRHDRCLVEALSPAPVLRELRAWMRMSGAEVRDARDGLTAPALGLPTTLAPILVQALRPSIFRLLRAAGLARLVVSEAAVTRTAMGVLVLHRPPDEPLLCAGRRMYRTWLGLTRDGLSACPMSALLDVPQGLSVLRELGVGSGLTPFAAFRVGPTPTATSVSESPRLPSKALLVDRGVQR